MKKVFTTLFLQLILTLFVSLQAQSLLWKISGGGTTEPSYLFGTIHITDKKNDEWVKLSEKKLPSCKVYAMEVDDKGSFDLGMMKQMMNPGGENLSDLISKVDFEKVAERFKANTGLSLSLFQNVQPLYISAMMEVPPVTNGKPDYLMMDLYLSKMARDLKLKVIGLETAEEQLNAIRGIPLKEQANMLLEEVKSTQTDKDLNTLYASGDIDQLSILTHTEMPVIAYELLLKNRNINMAERISVQIKKAPVFISVGAAHLGGEEGVINLLKKKGFELTAIPKPN